MKYAVYYNVPMRVEFDSEETDHENLFSQAQWYARNKSGAHVDIVQILPDGVPSQLLRDQPRGGDSGPQDSPPTGPKAPAGDQLLARTA